MPVAIPTELFIHEGVLKNNKNYVVLYKPVLPFLNVSTMGVGGL
jgi:hypothetical protein